MTSEFANPKTQLEDVMAAMDVVDTLRHEQGIAERELDMQGRRERLLQRLRELYQAQGITVSDRILEEGIDALEQKRFEYTPVQASWRTKLAHKWITRDRWGKLFLLILFFIVVLVGSFYWFEVRPKNKARNEFPSRIESYLSQIKNDAKNQTVIENAQEKADSAQRAIANGSYTQADELATQLQSIAQRLQAEYKIRVASRINENSGIWRIPPNNPNTRNFYIIVEAIDFQNKAIRVDILNEEDNKRKTVDIWGLRVSEDVFSRIAADKQDDGIIQNNIVGQKKHGYLEPTFNINTSGATITEW